MEAIHTVGKTNLVPVHIDGARLFNAAVALGVPISDLARHSDTLQVCLSKGLGAPVGSLLAGSSEFIRKARKWRKRLGGGMRQAGVIAAPGLIALTKMIDRLAEDHENAKVLAEGIKNIAGLRIANNVETNIVVADVSQTGLDEKTFVEKLKAQGVLTGSVGSGLIRLVTNYDVSKEDIQSALTSIQAVVRAK
jgi:threonine aldolase